MFNMAFNSMMIKSSSSRTWLASATIILFLLVQFAATAHAAEHAFHEDQSYCGALNKVENNKLLSHQVAGFQLSSNIVGYVTTLLSRAVATAAFHSYQSRAPPQLTV